MNSSNTKQKQLNFDDLEITLPDSPNFAKTLSYRDTRRKDLRHSANSIISGGVDFSISVSNQSSPRKQLQLRKARSQYSISNMPQYFNDFTTDNDLEYLLKENKASLIKVI